MNGSSGARSTNWVRLGALAGVAILAAVFLGWQSGEMIIPADPPPPRASWSLTKIPEVDSAKDLAVLIQRKPWSGGALAQNGNAAPAAKTAQPDWRLAGVVERPDGSFALIAIGASEAATYEYRAIGDKLPDGSTLVELTRDSATTRAGDTNGTQNVYRLFDGPAVPKKSISGSLVTVPDRHARLLPEMSPSPSAQTATLRICA